MSESQPILIKDHDADGDFYVLELSPSTELRFRASVFRGEKRFDVRKFVDTERYTGYTKSGNNIAREDVPDFLRNFFQMLKDEGVLEIVKQVLTQIESGITIEERGAGEKSGEVGAEPKSGE